MAGGRPAEAPGRGRLCGDSRPDRGRDSRRRHRRPEARCHGVTGCEGRARDPRREVPARHALRRHDDRGVPDRPRSRRVRPRRPRRRECARAPAGACRGGGDRRARAARRGRPPARAAAAGARPRARAGAPLRRGRAPAHRRARGDGGRGRAHRHLSHGGDHGAALGPDRGARGERVRARRRGVRARVAAAARARPLREARPHARAEGEDRVLHGREGAGPDPRRPRDRRRRRGVARADEAREHLPGAASYADRRGRSPAHDDQPDRRRDGPALDVEPEPAGDPDPHRARARDPLGLRGRAGPAAALRRLLADRAADPRARVRGAEAAGGVPARRGHPHRDRCRGPRRRTR